MPPSLLDSASVATDGKPGGASQHELQNPSESNSLR